MPEKSPKHMYLYHKALEKCTALVLEFEQSYCSSFDQHCTPIDEFFVHLHTHLNILTMKTMLGNMKA